MMREVYVRTAGRGRGSDDAHGQGALRRAGSSRPIRRHPRFTPGTSWSRTEAKAQELIGKLDEGADFAELAKEHSTGPSGPQGGDSGLLHQGTDGAGIRRGGLCHRARATTPRSRSRPSSAGMSSRSWTGASCRRRPWRRSRHRWLRGAVTGGSAGDPHRRIRDGAEIEVVEAPEPATELRTPARHALPVGRPGRGAAMALPRSPLAPSEAPRLPNIFRPCRPSGRRRPARFGYKAAQRRLLLIALDPGTTVAGVFHPLADRRGAGRLVPQGPGRG